MSNWSFTKKSAIVLLFVGLGIGLWVLIGGEYIFGNPIPDPEKAKQIQPFITALVTPLLTLGSTLLVLENLRATSLQNFSSNFFKLIDQHHKLVDNINTYVEPISTVMNPCKGRTFFDELAERIACDYYHLPLFPIENAFDSAIDVKVESVNSEQGLNENSKKCPYSFAPSGEINVTGLTGRVKLIKIYDHYFHIHQSDLGHYFRNLYHIVRYAEKSALNYDVQLQHVKILRAQLSNYEILLIAYNGMHPFGQKFHRVIEKFELLKNLNTEEGLATGRIKRIVDLEILKEAYPHFRKIHN